MVALGIALVWPVIATMQGWPAPIWAYAVTAIFIVIRIVYTLWGWRRSDEFMRQRTKDGIFWTYFIGQTALLAYAGGERLGLVAPITAWDVVTLTVALSIAVAAFAPLMRRKT